MSESTRRRPAMEWATIGFVGVVGVVADVAAHALIDARRGRR